ncbi:cytochrome-c peroxidase [Pseudogemmobacter blasticus]|uniref:Cytochrome-c peroxidase n=1 Tax=Fuscovulum blasticum DSM 2131 TaxID=1188250 RepID=A0A2T4J6T8_FUSBL|nr:cytochrome c peroxidase [Fuscovulum blasticum]PTE13573.1 cytochrome-c peroxidase [Fuscovulum blasticum DSM 2131]
MPLRPALLSLALGTAALADPVAPPAPLTDADFPAFPTEEVELGRLLFWDAELSGNRNIACASCHHPRFGTSDGLSLGMGEGGIGLGPDRRANPDNLPEQRIPRNAPALWNVGARGFTVMFADGRIEQDATRPSGFRTPLEDEMVSGFASLLSAQTMFPVLSNDEMAGHYEENEISTLVRQGRITGDHGAWAAIAARISALPAYVDRFRAVYPEIAAGRPIAFTDISNAVAAYMTFDFRSDTAPVDAWMRGEAPLAPDAMAGAELFYGKAGCGTCHSGALFTDMKFHAMGDPQIGPGKAERFESHQHDTGRMRVSNNPDDAYAFRTPSLRNVTLTGPWGHAGAFASLPDYLRQHIAPGSAIAGYTLEAALLPAMKTGKPDLNPADGAGDFAAITAAASRTPAVALSDSELAQILAFLQSLEDPVARAGGRMPIPDSVPSGLPVDR